MRMQDLKYKIGDEVYSAPYEIYGTVIGVHLDTAPHLLVITTTPQDADDGWVELFEDTITFYKDSYGIDLKSEHLGNYVRWHFENDLTPSKEEYTMDEMMHFLNGDVHHEEWMDNLKDKFKNK